MAKRIGLAIALAFLAVAFIVVWNWWNHISIHGSVEPFEFTSADGTVLRGEVRLPHTTGPFPAVVLVHGSGPIEVSEVDTQYNSNAFLKKGFAVLAYDKRGAGRSDGDFETASYADFVEDVLAGVRALRDRPDIDDHSIGLFAVSEGGWLAPEITMRDGQIRFIIMKSGPPMIAHEARRWELRNELIEDGATNNELIEDFVDLQMRIWTYYRDAAEANDPLPNRRAQLNAEVRAIEDRWPEGYSPNVAEFDQDKFRRWAAEIFYDPGPYLLAMDVPLLAVFGSLDQNIPAESSVDALERLREAAGKDIDIVIYPDRDHYFFKWHNIFTMGMPHGYFDMIGDWATEHID